MCVWKEMKITREEFENGTAVADADPLELFWQGIRAEATKTLYTQILRRIVCGVLEDVLDGAFEQRVGQFVRLATDDPDRMLGLLLRISGKLRECTELPHEHPGYMNPGSMQNYFKPLKKLLDMNDISVKWGRVYATLPERDNVPESRGWERRGIALMLRHARNQRSRALILVAASSGVRVGAFTSFRWSDLRPLRAGADGRLTFDDDGRGPAACAMLTVYARTSSSYPALITPEAYAVLLDYRGGSWTREAGRPPRSDDPVFKSGIRRRVVAIDTPPVSQGMIRVAAAAGLRPPPRGRSARSTSMCP